MILPATDSAPLVDGRTSHSAAVPDAPREFEAFVAAVLPKVLRLAASLGATGADAEDVAAEALARAYASWGHVGSLAYRDGWVLRTTSNLVYDRARRLARRDAPVAGVVDGFDQLVVERAALVDALRGVSGRQRQAVVLHHLAGLSVSEVADVMRTSPNSTKKHIARGVAALRARLAPAGEEPHHD